MVQLQQYLRRTTDIQNTKHFPLLNSLFVKGFSLFDPYAKDNDFKTYMKWARRSPQLMGFLNIIATDILSDNIDFFPIKPSSSGRNKVLKAKAFWKANKGLLVCEETIYDRLITDTVLVALLGTTDNIVHGFQNTKPKKNQLTFWNLNSTKGFFKTVS